ncbi:40S ribosomal eS17 domain-containing protein [Aspergillus fumigatus Af293]
MNISNIVIKLTESAVNGTNLAINTHLIRVSTHQALQYSKKIEGLGLVSEHPSRQHTTAKMGRVRTKTVKRSAKVIIERYYPKLTLDFETNKRLCDEIAIIASKRLRNKIAGYTTHLMKRIQRGPVRGISFKLQEEERERKDQYVPEVSALDVSQTESGQLDVDADTKDLLKSMGFDNLKVNVVNVSQHQVQERPRRFR